MPSATPHDKHPEIPDPTIEDPGAWSSSDESGTDDEGQKHADNREQNSAGNGSFKPADPEVPATSTTKNISKIRGDFFQNFIGSWIKAETQLKDEDFEESIRECMAIDTQSSEPTYLHSVVADKILSPDQKKFLFRIAFRLDPAQVHHTGGKEVRSALHLAALSDPQWAAKGLKSGKKHAVEEKEDPGFVPFICSLLKSTVSGTEAAAAIAVADACGDTCLHIAIRRDIVGVMDLIDLSDKTTFEKKRTGDGATLGNTPLHDALDFQWYHVQAPACKTKELLESMDIDEPTPSSKSATNGGQESACKECRVRNRKYRDTKKRRRGIVGEILRSFPDALAMRNGFGLSPFLYHQLTRENTVGKLQSNGTPDLATQKEPLQRRPQWRSRDLEKFGGFQHI
ncbi:hypothetical protein ACCO45_002246 [Purpureocillium lilacinum]|uniref:Uncharacterized protein n=1 Tax=Purpureocillium lilacinum TaxID=33203 RepID=A0ACC4E9I2_PURLI